MPYRPRSPVRYTPAQYAALQDYLQQSWADWPQEELPENMAAATDPYLRFTGRRPTKDYWQEASAAKLAADWVIAAGGAAAVALGDPCVARDNGHMPAAVADTLMRLQEAFIAFEDD